MPEIPPRNNEEALGNEPKQARFNTKREKIGWYSEEQKKQRQEKLDEAARRLKESTARFEEDSPEKKKAAAILEEMGHASERKKEKIADDAEKMRRDADNRAIDENFYEVRKRMRRGDVPEEVARNNPFAEKEWGGKKISRPVIIMEDIGDWLEDTGIKARNALRALTFQETPRGVAKRKAELDEMVRHGDAELVGSFKIPTREEMMVHPPKKKKPIAKIIEKGHDKEGEEGENEHELIEALKEALGDHEEKKKPQKIDLRVYDMLKKGDKAELKDFNKKNKRNPDSAPDFYHETVGVYNRKGYLVGALQYRIKNKKKGAENNST